MALNILSYKRVFKLKEKMLTDPDPTMSPDEVMMFYSNLYPELTTSNVFGPNIEDDKAIYEFKTTIGTKG